MPPAVRKPPSPIDFGQCLPVLKDPMGHGSKMKKDRVIVSFLRMVNRGKVSDTVQEFLRTRKSCQDSHRKGYVKSCHGVKMCCDNPWVSSCDSCETRFAECDGKCIPREWVIKDVLIALVQLAIPQSACCLRCPMIGLTAWTDLTRQTLAKTCPDSSSVFR